MVVELGLGDRGEREEDVICRRGRGENVGGVVVEELPFLRDITTDKLLGLILGLCW